MKTILAIFLILLLLIPVSTFGEIQTITHTVRQAYGGSQSADDARIAAMARAKREALEMAGTYVEATTVVKNFKVEKDEILALTAGVLKAEIISQKNFVIGDAFAIEIVVRINVDTSVLADRVKKVYQDRKYLELLRQAQAREKDLLNKLAKLEEENRKLSKNEQGTEVLKEQFYQTSQGLTAIDWFYKALALWRGGKYAKPQEAVQYLNNAINLRHQYADAYVARGLAYHDLSQHDNAIKDYETAIRFESKNPYAYNNRGTIYVDLEQYQHAVEDFNQAIKLKPDYAYAYSNRGAIYDDLGQYQRAIDDCNKAIRLEPGLASAYVNRAKAYINMAKYQEAMVDCNQAIRLDPDFAMAYNNRGIAFDELGKHQQAIEEFNKTIRLKPNADIAYVNRAKAYIHLSQYQKAIDDCNEAIRLKPNNAYAYINRGLAYGNLGENLKVIDDCNEAIRIKPDFAMAYNNRGIAYILLNDSIRGCSDFERACRLGICKAYNWAKNSGTCH